MSSRLDRKPQIQTLASDLGLHPSATPCQQILLSVEERVRGLSRKFKCKTLNELLIAVANEVGTVFREIHCNEDLRKLEEEYLSQGELIFANLAEELSRSDDYGITIRLRPRNPWGPRFVSVIDCRGDKKYRTYFTKWHELAHLLTLTPQMRLLFRRSHSRDDSDNPEEQLMDLIASTVGFLSDFLPDRGTGELSFEGIRELKKEFCPDSSLQAATIGIVKAFPTPCILLEAMIALKKEEITGASQMDLGFRKAPMPCLRAVHVTVNTAAREAGVLFFRNLRVPGESVITDVFRAGGYAEADEDLDWWGASSGERLDSLPVRVKARNTGESVQALIMPISQLSKTTRPVRPMQ